MQHSLDPIMGLFAVDRRRFLKTLLAASAAVAVDSLSDRSALAALTSRRSAVSDVADAAPQLTFQTAAPWSGRLDVNSDAVILCGRVRVGDMRQANHSVEKLTPYYGNDFSALAANWAGHGYRIEFMTAAAQGHPNFINGSWDGVRRLGSIQINARGSQHFHLAGTNLSGHICPGTQYGVYLSQVVAQAMKDGAEAIYLQEPEFAADAGWSSEFRKQWKYHYHEDWRPPGSSIDAQWRASQLKYFLFRRLLQVVGKSLHRHELQCNRKVPFYVATHSLFNYAGWGFVSPESSLINVSCDGYIAQVWSDTALIPNVYQGRLASRSFETAFLEFGVFQNFIRGQGRHRLMWFLADPASDVPDYTWSQCRDNWQDVLTASLFYPEVTRYEVMPWPERVFAWGRRHLSVSTKMAGGRRVGIPADYATELQAAIAVLPGMNQPPSAVHWLASGTTGIGVLVSDTMLFQRAAPSPSDPHLGSFYGLAMPLLKRGMPVEPVQIEYAVAPGFLERYRVLVLTYEGQKPPVLAFHDALAAWVKRGGALVVIDDDKDPYNAVREWWNKPPMHYATPRDHLFALLGVSATQSGMSRAGRGFLVYQPLSPAALSYRKDGDKTVCGLVRLACKLALLPWKESASLVLRRGPYVVTSGLTELKPGNRPMTLHGRFIPLFNARLPLVTSYTVAPGTRNVLVDLDALPRGKQGVIAAACRVRGQTVSTTNIKFLTDGIEDSHAVVCIMMPQAPRAVWVAGKCLPSSAWDYAVGLLRIRFTNTASGVPVDIHR